MKKIKVRFKLGKIKDHKIIPEVIGGNDFMKFISTLEKFDTVDIDNIEQKTEDIVIDVFIPKKQIKWVKEPGLKTEIMEG